MNDATAEREISFCKNVRNRRLDARGSPRWHSSVLTVLNLDSPLR
jgi:hypothetical protein